MVPDPLRDVGAAAAAARLRDPRAVARLGRFA
jgi:hypothetical protein